MDNKLLIITANSINKSVLIKNDSISIYFPKFKTLFINATDQFIITFTESILTDTILKLYPNTKIYLASDFKLNISFTSNSIIFKDKPEYCLNYLEFYRYRKIKLSNSAINKTAEIWKLNSKFVSISSFEKLVDSINKQFDIKYNINEDSKKLELSQLKLRTYDKNNAGCYIYSSLETTIKTIFVTNSQLKDIQNLFKLENQYSHDLVSLIKLLDSAVIHLKKKYNTVYNHNLLKIVICIKMEAPSITPIIPSNTFDFELDLRDFLVFDYITIIFAGLFAIKLHDLNDLNTVMFLKYFDLSDLEANLQYLLLTEL